MLEDNFANWQNSAVRCRIQAKEMFETVDNLGNNVIDKICTLLGQEPKVDEKKRFFQNLRNTFNTYDKNNTGTLQFSEYYDIWTFLNQKGGKDTARKAFEKVDLDNSGFIEFRP
eukprot:UN31212